MARVKRTLGEALGFLEHFAGTYMEDGATLNEAVGLALSDALGQRGTMIAIAAALEDLDLIYQAGIIRDAIKENTWES